MVFVECIVRAVNGQYEEKIPAWIFREGMIEAGLSHAFFPYVFFPHSLFLKTKPWILLGCSETEKVVIGDSTR